VLRGTAATLRYLREQIPAGPAAAAAAAAGSGA
jgi:hypothetical protein